MLIELDDKDIERIANKVIESFKPLLRASPQNDAQELILDVNGLASYLKVNKSWVYERTHLNEMPHYKIGKFTRFKKKDIDKWLEENKHFPIKVRT
jgi:excisionase family DNA binding protein